MTLTTSENAEVVMFEYIVGNTGILNDMGIDDVTVTTSCKTGEGILSMTMSSH